MAIRLIPWEEYPRKTHFEHFCKMEYPFVGLTATVDLTDFMHIEMANNLPLFLSINYCVGRAANRTPAFRQRIHAGRVAEYDRCDTSHVVLLPDSSYTYCRLNCMQPYDTYLPQAIAAQKRAEQSSGLEEGEDAESLIYISTVPWIHQTALIQPISDALDSNPRFVWGKIEQIGGRFQMPLSLQAHHALVDGVHIAEFFRHLEEELAEFCKQNG